MISRRDFTLYSLGSLMAASTPLMSMAAGQESIRRPIRGSNELLPVVGLGGSSSFRAEDLTVARNLIDIFLEHGGGYVDLGGASRYNVGKITREKDAAGSLFFGNYVSRGESDQIRTLVKELAHAQGKSQVDLLVSSDLADYRANVAHFKALKEEGLARYIGVARIGPGALESMIEFVENDLVDFVQINYSMVEPEAADRLLPLALDRGVTVVINRPFINGKYFDLVHGVELPEWAAEFDCNSWAQFSLKFIIANPAVNCVLTETTNPRHAVDNLGAARGRLPDAATRKRMFRFMQDLTLN